MPSRVNNGEPATGLITLTGPAPVGTYVIIASNADYVICPPGVHVQQGIETATFDVMPIIIGGDGRTAVAGIFAEYSGSDKVALLTVKH